ncbi:movement protein [Pueraria virus A]|uniref:Movement protein n=1 Tax=Pueraria virus A TaxID=2920400 RepID=A0A8T9EEM5_9VIRU|nr:movement protein [Pueraria virus A]
MSDLYPSAPESPVNNNSNESYFEEQGIFAHDIQVDPDLLQQIEKTELSLSNKEVFHTPSLFTKTLSMFKQRSNHVISCISTREYALDIKDTVGVTEIPLISKQEIEHKLSKLKPEVRRTIGYINIGLIKIMVKSTFRTGVDSPIKLALLDRRLNNIQDALFGGIQGNLSYGKLMFSCSPRISVSLRDKEINQILCLAHEFSRTDLMNQGRHPYTVTYMLGYTLSNSHHSMSFRNNEPIKIEALFRDVIKASPISPQELSPLDSEWTMDLSRKPLLGQQPKLVIQSERPGLARSLSRMHGLPRSNDIHSVSRRIKELSIQLE